MLCSHCLKDESMLKELAVLLDPKEDGIVLIEIRNDLCDNDLLLHRTPSHLHGDDPLDIQM